MQSFTVEDRAYRSMRAWPIWTSATEQYLVKELGHEVRVDGINFDTAPIKNGVVFSLMGISFNERTVEAGLHDATNSLSCKAFLEDVYIKLGDQVIRHRLDMPYHRDSKNGYRVLEINERVKIALTDFTRDKDGCILSKIDAFTAAGIQIELIVEIASRINLELGDTCAGGSVAKILSVFPAHPSLKEHDIRMGIHADIEKLEQKIEIMGFTIDIDRKNWLDQTYRSTNSHPEQNSRDTAAVSLAARYNNAS